MIHLQLSLLIHFEKELLSFSFMMQFIIFISRIKYLFLFIPLNQANVSVYYLIVFQLSNPSITDYFLETAYLIEERWKISSELTLHNFVSQFEQRSILIKINLEITISQFLQIFLLFVQKIGLVTLQRGSELIPAILTKLIRISWKGSNIERGDLPPRRLHPKFYARLEN